ncbi:hypothetical protein GGTG_04052 [Gaeumannomyces tritici R3-111a-1]|uniref:Uncharacterized protein n=1 Tax=Gaeumannomyces tritici (strain R3-111a-1) TaxID=644352 RepID=J3NS04_GAET3|nr:hypothetical protein GGTG_04052 [Gaeumannomyces tritici R3-111a-1]EJT78960.1 hypothetical protein GGTG_04052 [Gaeumannomyces tritici R3-111a-1]
MALECSTCVPRPSLGHGGRALELQRHTWSLGLWNIATLLTGHQFESAHTRFNRLASAYLWSCPRFTSDLPTVDYLTVTPQYASQAEVNSFDAGTTAPPFRVGSLVTQCSFSRLAACQVIKRLG